MEFEGALEGGGVREGVVRVGLDGGRQLCLLVCRDNLPLFIH